MVDDGGVWSLEKIESNQATRVIAQGVLDQKPRSFGIRKPRLEGVNVACVPPLWWFQHFDPCWRPLRKWLGRRKAPTLTEFQLISNEASGLTDIEKTIAVSACVVCKNMQF